MRHIMLLVLVLALSGCSAGGDADISKGAANPVILKTYEVPGHAAREIQNALNYLLSGSGERDQALGRATLLGANQIVVAAPAAMDGSIARLIEAGSDSAAGEVPRLRFNYWLVRAKPNASVRVADELAAIEAALEQIAHSVGPMAFTRVDFVQNVLLSGARSQVSGAHLEGNVHAVARGERIAADLGLVVNRGEGRVHTEIEMKDGETIVLALVGDTASQTEDHTANEGGFLAFAIRAEKF
ncbi:MAG: hypothetical protein R3200_01915 [Xanthomonadales bacterium]|nr:hypothetical protein [Xanthomonadales bacterium]